MSIAEMLDGVQQLFPECESIQVNGQNPNTLIVTINRPVVRDTESGRVGRDARAM